MGGDLECWRGGNLRVVGNALYAVGHREYYAPDPEDPTVLLNTDTDVVVKKLSLGLELRWERTFGSGAKGTAVAADLPGNVYAVGITQGAPNAGVNDVVVRKFNAAGEAVWTRQLGGAGSAVANDAAATSGRGAALYLVGETSGALEGGTHHGSVDAFLLRRNGPGNEVWTDQ